MTSLPGYLGIDAGTQGLSAVYCDDHFAIRATGEGSYAMRPGLPTGCYEQHPADWEAALRAALDQLRAALHAKGFTMAPRAIGLSGQMHGEVLLDAAGTPLAPARLWCDARNEQEGLDLTAAFGTKIPKRLTVARWLWTLRQRPEIAARTARLTTPVGYLFSRLTGRHAVGVGEASGMFPVATDPLDYDPALLQKFATLAPAARPLKDLLPSVLRAGDLAGTTTVAAAALGLPEGIPVAPVEGDQPASLAGAFVARPGTASLSYGTSICTNLVGDKPFAGIHPAVDTFRTPDGKSLNLVWMRNGTTYLNTIVGLFQKARGDASLGDTFAALMPAALAADHDAGLHALPFMDDEPSLDVPAGGTALLLGIHERNATPGQVIRAALLASAYNLRANLEVLLAQGFPLQEIVLSGGLTRTPAVGQLIADAFHTPVRLLAASTEGTAFGAAVLAAYTHARKENAAAPDWPTFLESLPQREDACFTPNATAAAAHDQAFARHKRLLKAETHLRGVAG